MNKSQTINVFFCGTGGQGVLTAAEILGQAALLEGYHVKKSEVHGMAQRGGSVESHLRFGKTVYSPLIPQGGADFLVSFHKDESTRLKEILRPGGEDLTGYIDKGAHLEQGAKYLNTYLLGVLSERLPIKENNWLKALEAAFKNKNLKENIAVFQKARKEVRLS
ncbi:MAG: indolepyruvate oxidoreductase subunit beta [Candidatus Omnitrophica bacterium]|nr:indolepyruvate oxidoreductase subunit beta [Candidatus Omnitrophota bacterium]